MTRRFWIEDEFVDAYAIKLSPKAICVYMCFKRYADGSGITNVGKKTIVRFLGMAVNTVKSAIQELEREQFLSPFSWEYRKRDPSCRKGGRKIYPLREQTKDPKGIGNYIKEEESVYKKSGKTPREQMEEGMRQIQKSRPKPDCQI